MRRILTIFAIALTADVVLPVTSSGGDSAVHGPLAEADGDMSWFQLSKARLQKRRDGTSSLVFEYRRVKRGKDGPLEVVVRLGESATGNKMFAGIDSSRASGTYRVRLGESVRKQMSVQGAEIFVIMELLSSRLSNADLRTTDVEYRFKVSNSITLGLATPRMETRPITADEKRRVESWRKLSQAVALPSSEYVLLSNAARAAPGMPAMLYKSETWLPVEYVGEAGKSWKVVRLKTNSLQLESTFARFVAVKIADVERLGADPGAFTPSVKLVPGLAKAIPQGFVLCPPRLRLVPGTPVKARHRRSLIDGFVLSEKFHQVEVEYNSTRNYRATVPRGHIMVTPQVIEWLQADDAADRFHQYLEPANQVTPLVAAGVVELEPAGFAPNDGEPIAADESVDKIGLTPGSGAPSSAGRRKLKSYPINAAIPDGMLRVDPELPLQRGAKLRCSWGSRWYTVTVLGLHNDGAVRVHWDDFGGAWDADLSRQDLIISERLARILSRNSRAAEAMPRKWIDKSGQFEVLAYYLDSGEGKVHLRKPNGQQLSVPTNRLSEVDQRIVQSLQLAVKP